MKLNFILIILFIVLKQIFAECFEPIDIFKLEKTIKKVDCGDWINEKGIKKFNNNDGNKLVGGGNETMFKVTFTCLLNDKVLCDKAQKAFDRASNSITNTLKLKEQVTINATFFDFCGEGKNDLECPLEAIATIGETSPKRFYSLLSDDDKMERIYPQALVKQFQFPEHPQYDDFDIIIHFNSRVRFYFPEDTTPIGPKQYDFEFTVTHELLHGLGFYSLWQPLPFDETNDLRALCPPIVVINSGKDGKVDSDSPNEPLTVKESIFDKYMIRLDNGSFISEYTKKMQNYVSSNEEATLQDFLESQFPIMRTMFLLATRPKSLGFLPHNSKSINDAVILETSIPGYQPGSSVSHVDLSTYNNTSDYLMAYKGTPGRTTTDFISIGGNYPGGVIGPKTKSILESIGYATEEYPEPIKPQPFVKSSAKHNSAVPISAISNSVIFSQFYIMIFVIVILL
ncbi:unnamed protein product [Rhizophagus irregularis]|nr:unnamed protein product [Rhizophagus irregularis]CAB5387742.1 unnamed protein product [Rhizophagus irregularis]